MQKNLIRRIAASLILSVMLFALPFGAFIANTSNAVTAYAEDDVSGNASDETDPDDGTDDETIGGETGTGNTDDGNAGDGNSGHGEEGEEGDDPTPNRLRSRHLNRRLSASATTSAVSTITTRTVPYAVLIISTVSTKNPA